MHEPAGAYRADIELQSAKPVNVASVPQRSPFRYPGGKTWLVPYVRAWLQGRPEKPAVLVEPFAGGAIVGLTAGFEHRVEHVVLVEIDPNVSAVWKTILRGDAEWLANRIVEFELTRENAIEVLESEPRNTRERAFATILRNRIQRGGIMAPGAGLMKVGENGRGLHSRWYPQTLARRIREIAQIRDRFTFIEGDGVEAIRRYADRKDTVFFVDPPYTVAARRLYSQWQIDHPALFSLLARVRGDVLLTYDNSEEIRLLAGRVGFEMMAIAMKNTHHARQTELLIGRDLSWLRTSTNGLESPSRNAQATLAFHP